MGICESKDKSSGTNTHCGKGKHSSEDGYEIGDILDVEGEVHMLITGIDYSCDKVSWAGQHPLDTKYAWDMMNDLADKCEVTSKKTMFNKDCTIKGMQDAIKEVSKKCGKGDYFVFYYTGHGDQLPSDGDDVEEDGADECFCLVDNEGKTDDAAMTYRQQVWWRDDDFAECLIKNFKGKGAKLFLIIDCCHSASICDFETNPKWEENGIEAVSICGCQDKETSAGTGKGGMFSRALTMAVQSMNNQRLEEGGDSNSFMAAELYNVIMEDYKAHKQSGHTQHITLSKTGCEVQDVVFPLQPKARYTSPTEDKKYQA